MTGFVIRMPRGEVPRRSERIIGDNFAQVAENCKVKSGRCDPVNGLLLVHTSLASQIDSMFRYRHQGLDNWLLFDRRADVARSPVNNDPLGRLFYTGDGEPRMTTYTDAINGLGPYPAGWWVLGVTPPITAATINVTGGVGANEERAYVYTFKTRFGEESGPSPATLHTGKVDGSWDLSNMDPAPPNSGTISAAVADTPVPNQVEVTLNTVFGLEASEEILIAGVSGMTDLNGTHKLLSVNRATNKVVVALVTAQVYSAGADTWTRVAPHNTADMTRVIYRTVGSNTDYKRVDEIPASLTTYSDIIPAATVSLNEGIPSLDTLPPPKDMHSMVLLANNSLAGISGNQVCLSDQGKPYSWPLANRYAFPGEGRRLVASGNAAIILTDNYPHIITATVPEAGTVAKLPGEALAPCISAAGVVDVGGAALYPAHDGLYLATPAGVTNLTASLFTKDDWQKLRPDTFRSAFYDGLYIADHATDTINRLLLIDVKEPDSVTQFNDVFDAIYTNPWDSNMYVAKGNKIYQWDADNENRFAASWRSKVFQLPRKVNMAAAQVHARYGDIIALNNPALEHNIALMADVRNVDGEIACAEIGVYEIAASALLPVPEQSEGYLQFTLIRDGQPVFTKLLNSDKAFKLPAGKKSELYAVEISGSIGWESVNVAESIRELGQVS